MDVQSDYSTALPSDLEIWRPILAFYWFLGLWQTVTELPHNRVNTNTTILNYHNTVNYDFGVSVVFIFIAINGIVFFRACNFEFTVY